MTTKSIPLPPKTPISPHSLYKESVIRGNEKGVPKGEKPRGQERERKLPPIVTLLCLCPQCGGGNKVVTPYPNTKPYHKCLECEQVVPLGAFRVIAFSNEGLSGILPMGRINEHAAYTSQ